MWPFTAEQRLEMVHREDVVTALYKALITPAAQGKTLNIAGEWQQTSGRQYVADHYEILGVPLEMAAFRGQDGPGGSIGMIRQSTALARLSAPLLYELS